MKERIVTPVTSADFKEFARRRLPRFLIDYIDGGCNNEDTLRANEQRLRAIGLRQRVMRDVSRVNTEATLLGRDCSMPLALAPVGMAGMMARRGEVMGARAADRAGVPFTLSTVGICSYDEVARAAASPPWFQLYMLRDRDVVRDLLQRVRDQGCDTLLFTVDLAVPGMRHRDVRNGMLGGSPLDSALAKATQLALRPRWIMDVALGGKPLNFGNLAHLVPDPNDLNAYKSWIDAQFDPSVTWEDIAWLRDIWPGKLVIKGVLEVDDAQAAARVGADGIVVSNHGGRQLDSVAASIDKLPAIAAAVGAQLTVFMDGGVRGGIDIAKALACGAHGVLIGRPWVWAAAGGGQTGLERLLRNFREELAVAMALLGVNSIAELDASALDGGTG